MSMKLNVEGKVYLYIVMIRRIYQLKLSSVILQYHCVLNLDMHDVSIILVICPCYCLYFVICISICVFKKLFWIYVHACDFRFLSVFKIFVMIQFWLPLKAKRYSPLLVHFLFFIFTSNT